MATMREKVQEAMRKAKDNENTSIHLEMDPQDVVYLHRVGERNGKKYERDVAAVPILVTSVNSQTGQTRIVTHYGVYDKGSVFPLYGTPKDGTKSQIGVTVRCYSTKSVPMYTSMKDVEEDTPRYWKQQADLARIHGEALSWQQREKTVRLMLKDSFVRKYEDAVQLSIPAGAVGEGKVSSKYVSVFVPEGNVLTVRDDKGEVLYHDIVIADEGHEDDPVRCFIGDTDDYVELSAKELKDGYVAFRHAQNEARKSGDGKSAKQPFSGTLSVRPGRETAAKADVKELPRAAEDVAEEAPGTDQPSPVD